ncbi:hypothetical protein HU147_11505 [Planomicrobium chinense]|uniref:hypothetical protein n=1 Tax=Planococcus chinensis TaxID=272917 RepID=UPI001CC6F9A1|nr:hypothetical protein [Planococcus chinensis]MBZ5201845.1 hypothetical protein [Planococcus chinensis]
MEVNIEKSVITDVEVDSFRGLKILMSESYVLEVFPDSSNGSEIGNSGDFSIVGKVVHILSFPAME